MTDYQTFDSSDDELNDWEYPDEDDYDDDESDTIPCPNCGADVYEDAVQCPVCGQYVTSDSTNLWAGRSAWWILLALLGVGAVIWVLLLGGL